MKHKYSKKDLAYNRLEVSAFLLEDIAEKGLEATCFYAKDLEDFRYIFVSHNKISERQELRLSVEILIELLSQGKDGTIDSIIGLIKAFIMIRTVNPKELSLKTNIDVKLIKELIFKGRRKITKEQEQRIYEALSIPDSLLKKYLF